MYVDEANQVLNADESFVVEVDKAHLKVLSCQVVHRNELLQLLSPYLISLRIQFGKVLCAVERKSLYFFSEGISLMD